MKTLRPNSRDITRNLARNHREARPIAQLIALTQHYGAPTVRIHTAHAHDAQLISYDHGTLHLHASGARADNAATEIPAKPHTHEQETHRIHASINTIYPTPSIATHTHPTHR